MDEFTEDRDGLIWRSIAIAQGHSDQQIKRAVRSGELCRIWPGVYVSMAHQHPPDVVARQRVIAAVRSCSEPMPVSHTSAALIHRIPLLHTTHDRVHLTNGRDGGGRIERHRHIHSGLLLPGDVTDVGGLSVTTLERTVVDTAQIGSFDQALVAYDGALRLDADRDLLSAMVDDRQGKRGVGGARRALACANRLSESVGESWSRAQMLVCPDIPIPRLQHRFYSADGRFIARVDFDWEGRLVGEFDGLVKYAGLR